MGKLILVRHGESEGNRDRRFTTTAQAPMTELGRRQALEAAHTIRALFRPVLIVASPYLRASETARIIADQVAVRVEIHQALYEQDLGRLKGLPYEVVREDPNYEPARSWLWRPPGGESQEDVRRRTGPVLDRIAARYPDSEVVIVSHGAVMRALWAHVEGRWDHARIPPNCGIVLIEHEAGRYDAPRMVAGDNRPPVFY